MKIYNISQTGMFLGSEPVVGNISKEELNSLTNNRQILAWFRNNGYTTLKSKGKLTVAKNEYALVIFVKANSQGLFFIKYTQSEV